MKIAVFSDSHGYPERMLRAIEHFKPELVLHLGDGGRDVDKIKTQFPEIPLKAVKGNCDISGNLPETATMTINGIKLFMTHGHLFSVKQTPAMLISHAVTEGANIVLFGHTHTAANYFEQGVMVINPGTAGYPPMKNFVELEIGEDGSLNSRIIRL